SQLGKGCRVHVSLPRVDAPADEPGGRLSDAPQGTGTILVVEDQRLLRELIGQALESYGYATILAESAESALPVLDDKSQHLDLMLTDIVMPGMNGVELGTRATALRPALRILYMSGYAPEPKHRELFSRDGAAFIQKPFAPDELVGKLRALL